MIGKLFQKAAPPPPPPPPPPQQQQSQPPHPPTPQGSVTSADLDPRIALHYGIPSTASIVAFDPIQRLLAVGTLDGRIKVIGGDSIEALLISPKQLPFKNLEFLQNQGFLTSVTNENEIQVWDLEHRQIASALQWESNITSFSVIFGTCYMYIGGENGMVSALKYDSEEAKLIKFPYHLPTNSLGAGTSFPSNHTVVGVLAQPCSQGNRLLIAYENGLIILWDVSESQVVLVRGNKDLRLKDEIVVDSLNYIRSEVSDYTPDHEQVEKDISSLCWASLDGSILAVGYVDGDIMLWNLSNARADKSSNNVVKLQLSSEKRRLPVIVLRWSGYKSANNCGGQLFVYGGDEIGSEEVVTILKLDWSSGLETLKFVGRADLKLSGSFADLSVLPNAGAMESSGIASLCLLTNPGQLHVYDDASLSALMSQQEKMTYVPVIQYPMVIPTVGPFMTAGKLILVNTDGKFLRALSEVTHSRSTGSTKWPLTGGVPSQLSFTEENVVERVYVAGYHDGTVRMWDATYPSLLLIAVIDATVKGIEIPGVSASVPALDFCSTTLTLAIGNESGLVRLYKLKGSSDETSLHFVTVTEHEVHNLHQGNGAKCTAVFSLLSSPVRTLQYANFGARLAVGFECGRVAVIDISSLSTLYLTEYVCGSSSPIISLAVRSFSDINRVIRNQDPGLKSSADPGKGVIFILTKDAHVIVINGATGNVITSWSMHPKNGSIAISMYFLEGSISVSERFSENHSPNPIEISEATNDEPAQTSSPCGSNKLKAEPDSSTETTSSGQQSTDGFVLLCSENALCLYSTKSVIQGDNNSIRKVNLVKPCCWTTTFNKEDKVSGLVVLYPTGVIEIRSLPDLEVVRESSLMSIARWNFKSNMEKTLASSGSGQITMTNGSEFALVSLLANENDFRIPESLPCLHDKVVAAAANAAFSFSLNQNKNQGAAPGIFGIIKGFKVGKVEHNVDLSEAYKTNLAHLERIFSRIPLDPSTATTNDEEILELDIDDIEIDEPDEIPCSSSSHKSKNVKEDKRTEREKLLESANTDTEPRLRTPEEIMAKYRKPEDASAAAARARDRLVQRQEKLERISQRTEELQSGAENFAAMANELAKRMENRKWWKL